MFYDNKAVQLPWDYFLTKYERDLIENSIEDLVIRYPNIGRDILVADKIFMEKTQSVFNNKNTY